MHSMHDISRARFGGWTTDFQLPPGERVPGDSAADFAYSYLKNLIVTLQLPPLSLVTENEVAQAIDVSRTPVREAFLRLTAERLLEYLPRRGAMVPEITFRSIREQAETRVVLEGYGVDWVCRHRAPVAADLFALVEQQRNIYDDNPERILEMVPVDKEFHWTIVKATGNTEFAQLYNSLHDRQLRIGIAMFKAIPGRRCTAIEQHEEIAHAIERFDRDAALSLLEDHLVGSLPEVSGIFSK